MSVITEHSSLYQCCSRTVYKMKTRRENMPGLKAEVGEEVLIPYDWNCFDLGFSHFSGKTPSVCPSPIMVSDLCHITFSASLKEQRKQTFSPFWHKCRR